MHRFPLVIRETQVKTTISPHTNQNGYPKKIQKQYILESVWKEGNPPTLLMGMLTGTAAIVKQNMESP